MIYVSNHTVLCIHLNIYYAREERQRRSAKATTTFSQSDHDIPPIAEPPYGVIPK